MRHPRELIGHTAGDAFSALVLSGRYPDCRWQLRGRDVTRDIESGKYQDCHVDGVEASENDHDDQITALLITLATR